MRIKKLLQFAGLAVVLAATYSTSVYATGTYAFQFGNTGGAGQLTGGVAAAIDSAKNVYVVDAGTQNVKKYSSSGAYILSWGSSGSGNGQFSAAFGVTVDSSDNVYVTDRVAGRIQKFTSSGVFITKWGSVGTGNGQFGSNGPMNLAFANNQIYATDLSNNRVQIFTTAGVFVSSFGSSGPGLFEEMPGDITSDSAGTMYVIDSNGSTNTPSVKKYTSAGTFIATWVISNGGLGTYMNGIVVDRNGDIYLSDMYNGEIRQFTNSGADIATFGGLGAGNGQLNNEFGLAIGSLTTGDYLYVADLGNTRVEVFKILDPPPAPVVVTPTPATPAPVASVVVIPSGPPDTGL